jgi:hypothetical protein
MESELSGSERAGSALGFRWRASELEHYTRTENCFDIGIVKNWSHLPVGRHSIYLHARFA